MKYVILLLALLPSLAFARELDESNFYKGSYAPDGDYVLNGDLIKDLPPPIEVPVHYDAPGFDASRLSPVPAPGVHPRIIIGPEDIERFKALHVAGDNGYFADHDAVGCNNKPTAIDEYRMYDRTLSAEEIERIYRAELQELESGAKK